MFHLNWALTVFRRAVAFPSLSAAAGNIGMSQPQLSRIVARLEEELQVNLLDRSSRRFASWTKEAFALAETYIAHEEDFLRAVARIGIEFVPKELKVGCLEGLSLICSDVAEQLCAMREFESITVNSYDINELEEQVQAGRLDLIFTIKHRGTSRELRTRILGAQQVLYAEGSGDFLVISPFEKSHANVKRPAQVRTTVVSNSLEIRRHWIQERAASGNLPGPVVAKRKPTKNEETVVLVASAALPDVLWEELQALLPK